MEKINSLSELKNVQIIECLTHYQLVINAASRKYILFEDPACEDTDINNDIEYVKSFFINMINDNEMIQGISVISEALENCWDDYNNIFQKDFKNAEEYLKNNIETID